MEHPPYADFGERLRGAMKRSQVKGKDLADLLDVKASTVSEWRNGTFMPEGVRLDRLAQAVGVSPAWLRYGDEKPVADGTVGPRELRGYALAVRDMLASAQVAQQRLIDGLAALPESTPARPSLAEILGDLSLEEVMTEEKALDDLLQRVREAKAEQDTPRRKRA